MNDKAILGFKMDVFKRKSMINEIIVVKGINEKIKMEVELVIDMKDCEFTVSNMRNGNKHIVNEKMIAKKYQGLVDSMQVLAALIGTEAPMEKPKYKFMGTPFNSGSHLIGAGKTSHMHQGYAAGQFARFTNPTRISVPTLVDFDLSSYMIPLGPERYAKPHILSLLDSFDLLNYFEEDRIKQFKENSLIFGYDETGFNRKYKSITGESFNLLGMIKGRRIFKEMSIELLMEKNTKEDYTKTKPKVIESIPVKNKTVRKWL